jgi:hypothetical protein
MPSQPKSSLRTRKQDKSRQARVDAKARRKCVEAVWAQCGALGSYGQWGYCHYCSRVVQRTGAYWERGHVHETRARSLGGDPHDPKQCVLTCHACHFNGPSGAHRRSVRTV